MSLKTGGLRLKLASQLLWEYHECGQKTIKSDVWVCLKIGISRYDNFHRGNDDDLRRWEGADKQQLRLDFAYNFTGFGCGPLASGLDRC